MNGLVGAVALNTFRSLNSTNFSHVTPFPVVFTLQHSQIHVYTTNCGNEATYVELPINEAFGFDTALHIPNIKLHNKHVGLWRDFDYPWFEG